MGSADILGISGGIFIAIEIKIGTDKQRPDQVNFQRMIEKCGGFYFIVKNINDLEFVISHLLKVKSQNLVQ